MILNIRLAVYPDGPPSGLLWRDAKTNRSVPVCLEVLTDGAPTLWQPLPLDHLDESEDV